MSLSVNTGFFGARRIDFQRVAVTSSLALRGCFFLQANLLSVDERLYSVLILFFSFLVNYVSGLETQQSDDRPVQILNDTQTPK